MGLALRRVRSAEGLPALPLSPEAEGRAPTPTLGPGSVFSSNVKLGVAYCSMICLKPVVFSRCAARMFDTQSLTLSRPDSFPCGCCPASPSVRVRESELRPARRSDRPQDCTSVGVLQKLAISL